MSDNIVPEPISPDVIQFMIRANMPIPPSMLQKAGFVIVPFNAIAALIQVHTRVLDGIPIVEIGAKPDPFTNGVRDMHHYVESWLALRAVVHPEENGNGKHQAEASGESKDPVGT